MAMDFNRQHTAPLAVPRTNRNHNVIALTSLPAGKCVPIAALPMLREDSLRGSMRIMVEMQETKELLLNPVNLRVTAYVVPWLAFERFNGSRDIFDRSYMGEPPYPGEEPLPFFETALMGAHGSNAVYKALGLHAGPTDMVNTAYLEAYNTIWNFRAKNRSPDITERTRLETTLASAFWERSRFEHVVPDFDQAVIDGEVALEIVSQQIKVKGLYSAEAGSLSNARESDGTLVTSSPGYRAAYVKLGEDNVFDELYAQMADANLTVSLANIELARKTQAFAKLRERYVGHDDEYIIDMLMDGLTIPDQALKQPILLADRTVRFAQAKRYATDAENLSESAVSGAASTSISLRVPKLNTGGVVMVVAECLPEQLFERQRDAFFFTGTPGDLPEYLRDTLDPEKVDVVQNGEIDTDHSNPTGTFGYAPMNWKWNAAGPRVGGKFYRPDVDAPADDARQRLWAQETIDPALSEDFYLCKSIHTKPFLDDSSDPFEATVVGNMVINGNTVFGGVLVEAQNNYDKVMEKAPTERIEKGE